MKKFIVLVLFICLFLITYIYQDEIYNVYTSFASKPNVTLKEKNDYTRSYSFKYVSLTDNFLPETLEEVRNVYYTILNSGVDINGFKPVTLEELRKNNNAFKSLKKNPKKVSKNSFEKKT